MGAEQLGKEIRTKDALGLLEQGVCSSRVMCEVRCCLYHTLTPPYHIPLESLTGKWFISLT